MAFTLFSLKRTRTPPPPEKEPPKPIEVGFQPADPIRPAADPLEAAVQLGRFGYVSLNPAQWKSHPRGTELLDAATREVDNRFSLVPEGYASIAATLNDEPGCEEIDHLVEPFLLGRCCVTNAEYQAFVDAGGYQDLAYWPEDLWPHLIDFKDQVGDPGPRYWRNSRHDKRLAEHPVVGVSFFEAAAFARWAGYRLPTEPEWQMAASWRIRSAAHASRRYPWGDALDVEACNIWASGHGHTLPVTGCPSGTAPNGVMQLIGNVWEWTATEFETTAEDARPVIGEMLMKCIRGGSYDTYFPWQATSTFRSGSPCLGRTHNIGFRCALDVKKD